MAAEKVEQIAPCLSIEEDIADQERGWQIQKTVSYIILGLMVPIALGLFGKGMLSSQTVEKEGITCKYERFLHEKGSTQTDIYLQQAGPSTTVTFPLSYLDHFIITGVVPEPEENYSTGSEIVYRFKTDQTGRFSFALSPIQTGSYKGDIRVNGTPVSFFHFTYP